MSTPYKSHVHFSLSTLTYLVTSTQNFVPWHFTCWTILNFFFPGNSSLSQGQSPPLTLPHTLLVTSLFSSKSFILQLSGSVLPTSPYWVWPEKKLEHTYGSLSICTRLRWDQFSSVQSLSRVRLFATPWIEARQASLSITNSRSLPKLKSIESVMPSSHLILCRPLLLLPPIPPSIRVFSNESTLRMRWPQ